MASISNALEVQLVVPYTFRDLSLLQKALKAGDSNSDDREGHRGMAQVGDNMMSLVITSEGFDRGISRREVQETISRFGSKAMCSVLARAHRLDQMVVISERQKPIGPQPTTLKNVLAAIVAAVWLDSRDYGSVVQAMASLGLINYVEPTSSPQSRSVTPPSSVGGVDSDHGPWETDAMMRDVDFDAFLDTGMLGPEWLSTVFDNNPPGDWLAVDPYQPLNAAPELGATEAEWQLMLDDLTTTVGLPTLDESERVEQTAIGTNNNISMPYQAADLNVSGTTEDEINATVDQWSPSASQTTQKRNIGAGHSVRKNSTPKAPSSRIGSPIRLAFKAYMTGEQRKFERKPEIFNRHYGHMFKYQQELSSVKTAHQKTLASMALAIGDCSAMALLKQAVQGARSPPTSGLPYVGQTMSLEQRLKAIDDLDLCMAHLRLARWLHIYKLYEQLSIEVGGTDADGFVIMTNADLDQSSNETRTLAHRGKPRNLERNSIARRMMDHTVTNNVGESNQKNTMNRMKRLRRVGQRLQQLVNRWGIGVLSLLGPSWNEDMIMKTTDEVFTHFLDVVDRFEGENIRAVSDAAELGVQLFINDSANAPILLIEVVEEDVLQRLPRLSQDMEALFSLAN